MDRDTYIDEMMGYLRKVIEKMYDHIAADAAANTEAMRKNILTAVGISPEIISAPAPVKRAKKTTRGATKTRSPKGAVTDAVAKVFERADGLETKRVEEAVHAIDSSINPKTVYNELWRRTDRYRRDGGRWYRVDNENANPPADQTIRPNGSAGGHETQLFEGSSARAPAAAGEVGGT